jgi:hypothetical protein
MAVSRPGIKPAPIFSCKAHHTGRQREEAPVAPRRSGLAQVRAQSGIQVKVRAA